MAGPWLPYYERPVQGMENLTFVLVALLILAFGVVSERLQRSVVTAPMGLCGFRIRVRS
jgi:hypothetical protein